MTVILSRDLARGSVPYYYIGTADEFERFRPGAYRLGPPPTTPEAQHFELVYGTVPRRLPAGGVVSHVSAAILHGLCVPWSALHHVRVTRARPHCAFASRFLQAAVAPLDDSEIVDMLDLKVTSVARTIVDLARSLPLAWAVAAGDEAVRKGLTTVDEIRDAACRLARYKGAGKARLVADLIRPASESVGESVSRHLMCEAGLPAPILQYEVELNGRHYRADFYFPRHDGSPGVWCEFDGQHKYHLQEQAGVSAEERRRRQDEREAALVAAGYTVIRWTWQDLFHPDGFLIQIARALRIPVRRLLGHRPMF